MERQIDYGIQGNGKRSPFYSSFRSSSIVNDGLVIGVLSVRKVHPDDIHASSSELVHHLRTVCLWADCADDGGSSPVSWWMILGIERAHPLDIVCDI